MQQDVRYPRALVRYPCCLFRTPFGTHPACYLHRFCTHRNMPFGTQGPRSAPKGSKLRDPYRKSRFPLWPVNNLTAKVGGTGPGWRLIQDHRHSIVWGASPPKWSLFPPIIPPPAHVSTVMCKVVLDRRIFLTDWRGDQSVKKKNCQKYVCIFLCLVVFEEERDTLNRKTVLESHSMDSLGSKYSQDRFRQPFYGFIGLQVFSRQL